MDPVTGNENFQEYTAPRVGVNPENEGDMFAWASWTGFRPLANRRLFTRPMVAAVGPLPPDVVHPPAAAVDGDDFADVAMLPIFYGPLPTMAKMEEARITPLPDDDFKSEFSYYSSVVTSYAVFTLF